MGSLWGGGGSPCLLDTCASVLRPQGTILSSDCPGAVSPPRVIHTAGSPIVQKTDRGGCASRHAHVQILPGGPWGSPETTRLGQKGPNPTWGEGVAWKEHVRHLRFLSKPGALGRVQAGEVPSSRRHSGLCGFCFLPRGNTCFRISHTL